MKSVDPSLYAPAIFQLLHPPRLAPLDAGRPNVAARSQLEALGRDEDFAPQRVHDHGMADACRAGLWLYHDFLEESHTIAQELHSTAGSYWHALMHRREPDFSNAAYWFRRVGVHPIFEPLRQAAVELAAAASAPIAIPSPWDPFWFVDYCEACLRKDDAAEMLARQIQHCEWQLLFDHCYRQAAGQG